MSVALSSRRSFKGILPWAAVALCLTLLAASLVLHDTLFHGRALRASPAQADTAEQQQPAMSATVTLPEGKWKTAGIRTDHESSTVEEARANGASTARGAMPSLPQWHPANGLRLLRFETRGTGKVPPLVA